MRRRRRRTQSGRRRGRVEPGQLGCCARWAPQRRPWRHTAPDSLPETASNERRGDLPLSLRRSDNTPVVQPATPTKPQISGVRQALEGAPRRAPLKSGWHDLSETGESRRTSRPDALCGRLENRHTLHMRGHRKDVPTGRLSYIPGQGPFCAPPKGPSCARSVKRASRPRATSWSVIAGDFKIPASTANPLASTAQWPDRPMSEVVSCRVSSSAAVRRPGWGERWPRSARTRRSSRARARMRRSVGQGGRGCGT